MIKCGQAIKKEKMGKQKRKLTAAEKAGKRRRNKEYRTIFIHGKQKRVNRLPEIDGMDADEFIRLNADPIWLTQNEMWEELHAREIARDKDQPVDRESSNPSSSDKHSDIPF